jgi:ATP-dependent Lhr-like helicase
MPESARLRSSVGTAFFGRFKDLNALQTATIEPVLADRDVLLRAATASGKTEAAMAPLVERHFGQLVAGAVTIIVVSPTKALVNDLARRLEAPLDALGLHVGVRHGDRNQLKSARPPEVLITTPESFDIMVGQRPESLRGVTAVLIDEIHLLYNTQRGMQVAIALHRFETWLDRHVQVVGLSATVGAASDVWTFFRPGRDVEDINIVSGRGLSYQVRLGVSPDDLVELVGRVADRGKVLVFTNSRHECDLIADRLRESRVLGDRIYAHHSSLDRREREHVEASFADADTAVCVATSTLELGIDIGSIDLVTLYGAPTDWASLAQRIGRGNRRSSSIEALFCVPTRKGQPLSIVDQLSFQALMSEWDLVAESWGPQEVYGAAAQQLCAHILSTGGFVDVVELRALLAPWPHLGPRTVQLILDELVERDILQRHPAHHRYGASEGLHQLEESRDIWSNLTGGGFQVPVLVGERRVGSVSARNLDKLAPGVVFLLAGRRFRVSSADTYAIRVQPASSAPSVKLDVEGAPIAASPLRAEWVRRVLAAGNPTVNVRPHAAAATLSKELQGLEDLARDTILPLAADDGWRYLTFAGPILNSMIATWAGGGKATEFTVTTSKEVDWSRLPGLDELTALAVPTRAGQTVWQDSLPESLCHAEQRSWMRSNKAAERVLERLRRTEAKVVSHEVLRPFVS